MSRLAHLTRKTRRLKTLPPVYKIGGQTAVRKGSSRISSIFQSQPAEPSQKLLGVASRTSWESPHQTRESARLPHGGRLTPFMGDATHTSWEAPHAPLGGRLTHLMGVAPYPLSDAGVATHASWESSHSGKKASRAPHPRPVRHRRKVCFQHTKKMA